MAVQKVQPNDAAPDTELQRRIGLIADDPELIALVILLHHHKHAHVDQLQKEYPALTYNRIDDLTLARRLEELEMAGLIDSYQDLIEFNNYGEEVFTAFSRGSRMFLDLTMRINHWQVKEEYHG